MAGSSHDGSKRKLVAGPSSNWKSLQASLPSKKKARPNKMQAMIEAEKETTPQIKQEQADKLLEILRKGSEGLSESKIAEPGRYLAIDCEMVGVGPGGQENALARVSIVNYYGTVILDEFVRPKEAVTDYRTFVSGITPKLLEKAPSFEEVVKRVAGIVQDKVVIGHALENDLSALLMTHSKPLIRDTAKHAPIQKIAGTKRPGLKKITKQMLGLDIQSGAHSSVDDARATMAIYRTQKVDWERSLRTSRPNPSRPPPSGDRARSTVVAGSSKDIRSPTSHEDDEVDALTIPAGTIPAPREAGQQLLNFSASGADAPPPYRKGEARSSMNLAATLRKADRDREQYEEGVRTASERIQQDGGAGKKRKRNENGKTPGGAGRRLDTEVIGTVRKQVGGKSARRDASGGNWWE